VKSNLTTAQLQNSVRHPKGYCEKRCEIQGGGSFFTIAFLILQLGCFWIRYALQIYIILNLTESLTEIITTIKDIWEET